MRYLLVLILCGIGGLTKFTEGQRLNNFDFGPDLGSMNRNEKKKLIDLIRDSSSKYDEMKRLQDEMREKMFFRVIIGEKAYHIENDERLTWSEAWDKCTSYEDTYLVSLKNEQEWSALKEHLDSQRSYFLDIKTSNLEKETFLKWESGTPDILNSTEECVELQSGNHFMNKVSCSNKKNYICEFKLTAEEKKTQETITNYNNWVEDESKKKSKWLMFKVILFIVFVIAYVLQLANSDS